MKFFDARSELCSTRSMLPRPAPSLHQPNVAGSDSEVTADRDAKPPMAGGSALVTGAAA